MSTDLSPAELGKRASALRAAEYVESGMKVGLGTGSTAAWLVKRLGERVRNDGLDIVGVPTSDRTADLAREVGIKVVTLEEAGWLDITIDGADEFDRDFNLIKGGGGAHLREKIVATASNRMVVITDPSKDVGTLGAFPLPVEVVPFGMSATRSLIERLLDGADVAARDVVLRMADGAPYVTDEGNHILDLHLERIGDAPALAGELNRIAGVVENGLFIGMCSAVVIGREDGSAEVREA